MNTEGWKLGQIIWQKPAPARFVWSVNATKLVEAAEFRKWELSEQDYAILRVNGIKPDA